MQIFQLITDFKVEHLVVVLLDSEQILWFWSFDCFIYGGLLTDSRDLTCCDGVGIGLL